MSGRCLEGVRSGGVRKVSGGVCEVSDGVRNVLDGSGRCLKVVGLWRKGVRWCSTCVSSRHSRKFELDGLL